MIPFVDLRAQYDMIKDEIDEVIRDVVESSHFILGQHVESFESDFAGYCQSRFAVGVNSGTSALHLALLAAAVGPGDEVITASFTFVATAAAICYTGARPVFVDINPSTCTIDPAKIEAAITDRTKVIMPVHLYGNCADMDPILELARKHRLILIEDAAQAHGAEYKGLRAGSMGDLAAFSFYPGKNLGAYGEGGAVVTSNQQHAELMKRLRDHGQSEKYYHERIGYNYRMEAIQGAVLGVKLKHLDDWNRARRGLAHSYRLELKDAGVRLLDEQATLDSVHHVFPIFTGRRNELRQNLERLGINSGIHYPVPVHLQPGYKHLNYNAGDLPETERASQETLSLPMYPELTIASVNDVTGAIRQFCAESAAAHPSC